MHYSFFSRTRLVRVLALIGLLILSGCSTVRPWQNRAAQPGTIRTQESALQATIPPPSIVVVVALSGGGSRAAAFGLGEKIEADPVEMYLSDIFTVTANLAGLCGMSVPCGFTASGLPVGLQILGGPFREETILNIGYAYEQSTAWHTRKPTL